MKKQIYQLKSIAKSCQEFAKKVDLRTNAFTQYKIDESKSISIYCGSNHEIVSVYFIHEINSNKIEVTLYNDTITFPMSMTLDEMKEWIVDCSKIINHDFPLKIQKYELEKEMIIQSKIQELENQIRILKS